MEGLVDLHIHTTASDGTVPPREVVAMARALALAAIAITDHDTVSGVPEAAAAGKALGVEVIPGVEMSSDYRGRDTHILGLFVDPDAPSLTEALAWARDRRRERNEKIVAAMAADGLPISMEALRADDPDAVLGRPHLAGWLVKNGLAADVGDAFRRFLDRGRPYYLPRERMRLDRAAAAIVSAGGVAVIAHPFHYGFDADVLDGFIRAATDAGCRALEAYYPEHTPAQQAAALALADRYGLAVSGGSDFHGARKPAIHMGSGIDGSLRTPVSVLAGLRAVRPEVFPS